ncbi:MAG: prolyl oligopeptidase family serine peptidase [Planctomycetota bacterium]
MKPLCSLLALILLPATSPAAQQDSGYRLPPPEVVALLDAPETPSVRISPDGRFMLFVERPAMPSIADVSRPWIGLAGERIDPKTNAPWQASYDTSVSLRELKGKEARRVALPEGARIAGVSWSHTSRRFAITIATDGGLELWIGDVSDGKAVKRLERMNAVLGGGFDWTPDGNALVATIIPAGRAEAPAAPGVPSGPVVQETSGTKSPVRTYQDLLDDPHEELLFEHYGTSQIVRVDIATGKTTPIGQPGLHEQASVSPDGKHLLVSTLHRPFSYLMPAGRFPKRTEVWSIDGALQRSIADIPLGENIPQEGVPLGPRSVQWQASAPASLVWVEALDGGDPKRKAEWRDKWMRLAAPFGAPSDTSAKACEPVELFRLAQRARGLQWMADADEVLAGEYDRDRRWMRTLLFDLGDIAGARVVEDRSVNDRYGDPGSPVTRVTENGTRIVRQDGDWIYRSGGGATPEGARPFLDRVHLRTGKSDRLWRCENGEYESVVATISSSAETPPTVVTVRESPTEPPNWRLRDLAQGDVTPLTDFPDPQPQLRGVRQELVKYTRKDGVELSATLYLPKGYVEGTKLPLVVWAYPMEYSDPGTAGQVGGSPHRFVRVRGPSHLLFLTQGYAIFDNATMPVVGDPETMNDTFLDQVVASAQAAIDKAAEMGVADRTRVGVGGHSYGAFMTANLLAHCDLFRAGIARSGAYNRSLTPFGFQSERRTIWEAPEIYMKLSPFSYAHRIQAPILFVHGEKDSNPGTFPIQSERMYQAVKGNGGTARLVVLPEEDHGYRARESVMHCAAEMVDWFDKYVKNGTAIAGSGASAPVEAGSAR